MRLQKLTIHNIASVEDAVIDFDQAPLSESDVFLISGKTGSGKSTILDAICLALYSTTPRLKNTDMQGDVADGERSVKVNDPRQLMRRNTGEAFVELTFTGNNGVPYLSRWSVARANRRLNGNLQAKKWALTDLRTGFVLSKDDEIKAEISKAAGLDFSQFCRTTLLAQGEFTRFLNSKDDDKAAILEKITGVNSYTLLGRRIYEITNEKKKALEEIQKRSSDIPVLPEEEEMRLGKEMEAVAAGYDESLRIRKLMSDAFSHMTSATMYLNEMQTLERENAALSERFRRIRAGIRKRKEELSGLQARSEELSGLIAAEEPRACALSEYKSILTSLRLIYDARKSIADVGAEMKKDMESYEGRLKKDYENALMLREKTYSVLEIQKRNFKEIEEKLSAAGLAKLREEKDKAADHLNALSAVDIRLNALEAERVRHAEMLSSLQELSGRIENLKAQVLGLDPLIHDAAVRKETVSEMFERQRLSVDSWAKGIRARLQDGDLCPVCGQKVVEAAFDEDAIDRLFMENEALLKEAVANLDELNKRKDALNAQISAFSIQHAAAKRSYEHNQALANAEKSFAEACLKCGIAADRADIQPYIQGRKAETSDLISFLNTKISQAEKIEHEYREAAKVMDTSWAEARKADDAVNAADRLRKECLAKIEAAKSVTAARQKDVYVAEDSVREMVEQCQWKYDWKTDIVLFGRELKQAAESYMAMIEERNRLQVMSDSGYNELKLVEMSESSILQLNGGWADLAPIEADDYPVSLPDAAGTLLAETRSISDRRKTAADRLDLERNLLTAMIAENKELSDSPTMDALKARISETDLLLRNLGEQKGRLQQTLHQNQANREKKRELEEGAEILRNEYHKWSRLNMLVGDSTGKKFRQIAQSYVLSSLISSANSYLRTLTDRYTLKVVPGTFVILMEDAYQGYATRAASTISGGESFLVSLSLALALSDIGQQLAVDILFIDEGFGTLSGEPLQNAVNTLKTLHRKAGRRVGIISHVEELREKIPVQIRVNQEGMSSVSRIEVV